MKQPRHRDSVDSNTNRLRWIEALVHQHQNMFGLHTNRRGPNVNINRKVHIFWNWTQQNHTTSQIASWNDIILKEFFFLNPVFFLRFIYLDVRLKHMIRSASFQKWPNFAGFRSLPIWPVWTDRWLYPFRSSLGKSHHPLRMSKAHWYLEIQIMMAGCFFVAFWVHFFWSNYSDLTRPKTPNGALVREIPPISGKPNLLMLCWISLASAINKA